MDASVNAAEAASATGKALGGHLRGPLSTQESGTGMPEQIGAGIYAPSPGFANRPAGRLATLKTTEPAGINAIA